MPGVYAEALGCNNVIAFDMGGTTAKCALVEDGRCSLEFDILRRRYVLRISDQIAGDQYRSRSAPAVGSIAWRNSVGTAARWTK